MANPKYKLINSDTNEILAFGDDPNIIFGGPFGQLQQQGKANWVVFEE